MACNFTHNTSNNIDNNNNNANNIEGKKSPGIGTVSAEIQIWVSEADWNWKKWIGASLLAKDRKRQNT